MKVSQAILPVAGLGTRFLPWTKVVPKELLPIGNQPIIAHLVDECIDAGITDICFVISKGKELIPQYFFEDPALEEELEKRGKKHYLEDLQRYKSINFHTVYQDEQLGDGHAILQAADWVDSETIAILFGDDLFACDDSGLKQLVKAYDMMGEEGALLALENVPRENTSRYGVVDVDTENDGDPRLKKLKGMVEKPQPEDAPSTLGIVGRYLIPKSTFDVLPKVGTSHGSEIRLIDALIEQMPELPVYGYECKGTRIDTGTPEGYREAVKVWNG
ncbi:NTP transferase domain-containing protein [Patescibacteria group bacterium]|nr:NTP transferase domain-containing protein [Patescibacteria group bacterium]